MYYHLDEIMAAIRAAKTAAERRDADLSKKFHRIMGLTRRRRSGYYSICQSQMTRRQVANGNGSFCWHAGRRSSSN
jgi:hypothetical protein